MRTEIATLQHAKLIAGMMRPNDIREIRAGWDMEPAEAMEQALMRTFYARTLFHDLQPLCMYGLAPLSMLAGYAIFFIFPTVAIDQHPIGFCKASRRAMPELFAHCHILTNLIDVSDVAAMKWMAWLGGKIVLPYKERGGRVFAQFIVERAKRKTCRQA
jgi:hypothetical protein